MAPFPFASSLAIRSVSTDCGFSWLDSKRYRFSCAGRTGTGTGTRLGRLSARTRSKLYVMLSDQSGRQADYWIEGRKIERWERGGDVDEVAMSEIRKVFGVCVCLWVGGFARPELGSAHLPDEVIFKDSAIYIVLLISCQTKLTLSTNDSLSLPLAGRPRATYTHV